MFVLLRLKGGHVINKGREVLFYKSIVMSKVSFIQIYEVIFYSIHPVINKYFSLSNRLLGYENVKIYYRSLRMQ